MAADRVLELDHVSVAFGRSPVLTDVSLVLDPGQFHAIVGPNGAGKTTLVRVALGLLAPTSGTVRLFGTDVSRFRTWSDVGYVPQRAETSSALPMSVDEVVVSGLAGQLRPLRRLSAGQRERIEHVLDVMDLQGLRRRRVGQLSGGQQQRALIARAGHDATSAVPRRADHRHRRGGQGGAEVLPGAPRAGRAHLSRLHQPRSSRFRGVGWARARSA
jgi:zinc transport system ATP-binding protein